MSVGKRKTNTSGVDGVYDISKCHVVFRKARIDTRRKKYFDHNRELFFNHNRRIDARLQGVIFRDHFAIGFRNVGIGNIEEISDPEAWPKIPPAKSPDSLVVNRDKDYQQTWGRDQAYEQKWGALRDPDPNRVLMPAERIEPQLTYYSQRKIEERKKPEKRVNKYDRDSYDYMVHKPKKEKPVARKESVGSSSKSYYQHKQPVYQAIESSSTPIITPPPRNDEFITREPVHQDTYASNRTIAPKTKKKAFAYNEYALALMESGQYKRAMNFFLKAKNLDPYEDTYTTNMNRCQQWLDYKSRKGG